MEPFDIEGQLIWEYRKTAKQEHCLISVVVAVAVSGISSVEASNSTVGISAVVVTVSVWVASSVRTNGSVRVPRWIDAMDAEVLLSSLLILLGLGSKNESGQSQQKQNNLNNNILLKIN